MKPICQIVVRTCIVLAGTVLGSLPVGVAIAGGSTYEVGVAKIDITPDYPIRLHGFGGRRTESEGITQRIWAKALAIGSDAEKPVILFTVDNLGTRMAIVDEVAARLKEKAGIERQRIALTFTHSHTTPKTVGSADTIFSTPIPPDHQAHIDRYTAELIDALEKVALEALANRQPSTLEWSVGQVRFAKNRRTEGGPVDHDLPMLVVKNPSDESIRAIYVTYACHCVTLSDNKISGDWAGYAQEAIEHKHPGAIALVSIGCGSDSNPSSGVTGSNVAAAAEQGGEIATEVDRLLSGNLKPVSGAIAATMQSIDLPLSQLPTREELESLAKQDSPPGYNAKFQLARLDRGEPLTSKIDYPIQTWTFGDSLSMVFLAGEVCVDYSHRLKRELDANRLWLHGYSNDFCAYIPSERLVKEGGYGGGAETVYFALPATLKAGLEDKIIDEVHRQVPDEFERSPDDGKHSATQPWSPQQSIAAMHVADNLVVELVAAEPLVVDPVAIDFGPDGRLWVVEMRNYARAVDDDFEQTGQVSVLVDANQDGAFDKSTPFVTGLRFPTDVKVWRKGIIVCDAPDVIYLEDTDGDDRADVRKVLLTGFATHNAQARVNSLRWGLDGWLYGSCGIFGGEITSANGQQLSLGGRDFRFQPDTGKIEAVTGRSQQGRVRDDWQNWFGCENGELVRHYPLIDRYLARNPHVVPPADEVHVPSDAIANRLYPRGSLVLFKESGPPGRPTSACGIEIYRDDLLGAEFRGNAFVAEPVNQIVHREVLTPRGVSFVGNRPPGELQREFLASTDQWFRPVQIRTGPDGCLWIVDMHRLVIEHPRFIPEETLRNIDVMAGNTAGRIFRVRPRTTSARPWLRLPLLNTSELVDALDSPNGPQRDMVQQILIERDDESLQAALEKLVASSKRPEVRLQALYTLDLRQELTPETLLAALRDPHPGVRRHAIQLSETQLADHTDLAEALLSLLDDGDPHVQQQLAYSLGQWNDPRAAGALARIAWANHANPYIVASVLSSANRQNASLLVEGILSQSGDRFLPRSLSEAVVRLATTLGDERCAQQVFDHFSNLQAVKSSTDQLIATAELLRAIGNSKRDALLASKANRGRIEQLVAKAQEILRQQNSDDDRAVVAALQVVSMVAPDDADIHELLGQLLGANSSPPVQQAAVSAIAQSNPNWASQLLLENWSSYTPEVRQRVLDVFFERESLLPALLAAMESGAVKPNQIDALGRQRLLTHRNEAIRSRAANLFDGSSNPDRAKVIADYAEVASLVGNPTEGRALYAKHCASCHRLENQGFAVGPDLAALTSRSTSSLIESLFDPNRAIDERYQAYTATTDEGLVYTGILVGENATSITLLEQEGKERTLLRESLDAFANSQISLMPEGFERDLAPQQVADLLAYVAAQGQPPKHFEGNRPAVVAPTDNGVFRLLASNSEIYGNEIVYESPFKNVGYWHDPTDHVVWKLNVPQPGRYDVYLEWACADDNAGSVATIEGFAAPLRVVVDGTGGYDKYEMRQVGEAQLSAGAMRIIVRPDGPLKHHHLMDLRGVYLVPAGQKLGAERALSAPAKEISSLLEGVATGTSDEYRQIPAIWRVAVEAGKRNDTLELQHLLEISLPEIDQPACHWQLVVVGGGIVNGLTMAGVWPKPRVHELLADDEQLTARWNRFVALAATMADDRSIPSGTRYDALRMLGAEDFSAHGAQLVKYLADDSDELQMGAVSALGDIDDPASAAALIAKFKLFSPRNRKLAFEALLRSDERVEALVASLESNAFASELLTQENKSALKNLEQLELRSRAQRVLDGNP